MRLTEQQVNFYKTFGFLGFPGLLADRADAIIDAFEELWASQGGGHHGRPHDHQQRSSIVPFIDQHEYLSSLIDDPRIEGVVASLLGDDFNYASSDGNYYVGDTNWHSDGYRTDPNAYQSLKIALYLDPLTRDTGCLRVIPGSHLAGDKYADALQKDARQSQEIWGIDGRDVPCVALETQPGDVVLFNHNTKHASYGGSTRRRMFTLNFSQRYRDVDLDKVRGAMAHMATRYWAERAYGEPMVRTAGPGRMRHLEQWLANDGHLAELARNARAEMAEPSRH